MSVFQSEFLSKTLVYSFLVHLFLIFFCFFVFVSSRRWITFSTPIVLVPWCWIFVSFFFSFFIALLFLARKRKAAFRNFFSVSLLKKFLCFSSPDVNMVAEPKPHQVGRKRQSVTKTGNDCWWVLCQTHICSFFFFFSLPLVVFSLLYTTTFTNPFSRRCQMALLSFYFSPGL